jgi:hypothetical protein
MLDMYAAADAGAIACLQAKLAVEKSMVSHLEETRQTMQQKVRGEGEVGTGRAQKGA